MAAELAIENEKKKSKIQMDAGAALVAAEWGVWATMCAVFGCYVAVLAGFPMASLQSRKEEWLVKMVDMSFGLGKGIFLLFAAPILVLAVLAIIRLEVSSKTAAFNKKKVRGRSGLQEHPVVTKGVMGIVSAAELLWILFFLAMFVWIMANYIVRDFEIAETKHLKPYETLWGVKLKHIGLRLGFIGVVCLNLLFLPVSRGSVLLRAVGIPFEHATKYHVWLANFMLTLFTLHGLSYSVAWYFEGRLIRKLLEWAPHKITNLAGVISLLAGIAMWATSLRWVRQTKFELFFYTHQLYAVFVVFMAFHVGDFLFNIAFSGLFLFAFDRFLRFCQSRRSVGILSTKLLPCGTYELVIAKPPGMKYHALSFIFLNVPGISALQWHPFSVSSSPYDSDDRLKVLIKPYGNWSHRLQHAVSAAVKPAPCPFALKAAVEGPYGHESNYFLHYETLVLVAGGIGVSPFVAILRDLLQRCQRAQPNLPSDVTLIWAVQKSEELQLLDLVSASAICPDYTSKLNLRVHAFVTRESEPISVEQNPETEDATQADRFKKTLILASLHNAEAAKDPMSVLVGTGSNLWIGASLLASLLGYIVVTVLTARLMVEPSEKQNVDAGAGGAGLPFWVKGLLNLLSMVLGVVLFGGSVIALWSFLGRCRRGNGKPEEERARLLSDWDDDGTALANESGNPLVHPSNTRFGGRPNLTELFEGCAKHQRPGTNVGVLACGPESLQTSVAETCRAFNSAGYNPRRVAFSYHSVSFDL